MESHETFTWATYTNMPMFVCSLANFSTKPLDDVQPQYSVIHVAISS